MAEAAGPGASKFGGASAPKIAVKLTARDDDRVLIELDLLT
jgi:hypothetical protein